MRDTCLHLDGGRIDLWAAAVGSFHGIERVLADIKTYTVFNQAGNPDLVFTFGVHKPHTFAKGNDFDIDHIRAAIVLDQVIGRIKHHGLIGLVTQLQNDVFLCEGLELFALHFVGRCDLRDGKQNDQYTAEQSVRLTSSGSAYLPGVISNTLIAFDIDQPGRINIVDPDDFPVT